MAKKSMRFNWNTDVMRAIKKEDDTVSPNTLSDEEFAERCTALQSAITITVYTYLRRGLFETDKLMVSTLLCFKVRSRSHTHGHTRICTR
jgi:hypothetical protein